MDDQGSQNSSVGPGGVVADQTFNPFKFRILKTVLRLLIAAYALTGITYLAVYLVTYRRNVYMDTDAIIGAFFLALYVNHSSSNAVQLCWSVATNLFEAISLLCRRGSKSWSVILDLASIWLSAAACIYTTVMRDTYLQDPLAIHDSGSKHLLDTLHTTSMITVILTVFHIPILALTVTSYYLNRRAHRHPHDHIPGQRRGDLPLVDNPQHRRSGLRAGREGAVTPERPIIFPDNSPVAGRSRPPRVVLPALYNEPPIVMSS
ncbi:hypothetical protein CONLIGDRAFT_638711 [Coniochaeta ligniaria NRRL 30616]|uniref:Uncharacterized protein n=1 Tax=Coniochaeta ligniaria NRRL 30616 TaxID=1408157 RepID=A0A1J7JY36_9PEZI|nr:hypothetical protein CONLIGDRAFT_638711 [Coniochaeta ligniaria NRRL 30616]